MESKIQRKILELFLYNNSLKFSDIEKQIKERSNKIAYHIKLLIKKGIISKNNENYQLSETSEYLIPYLSEKKSTLPVILILIEDETKEKAFL